MIFPPGKMPSPAALRCNFPALLCFAVQINICYTTNRQICGNFLKFCNIMAAKKNLLKKSVCKSGARGVFYDDLAILRVFISGIELAILSCRLCSLRVGM
jgi:hypothetical protein